MKNKKSTNEEVDVKKMTPSIKNVDRYPLRERNRKETVNKGSVSVKSSLILNLTKEKQKTRNFAMNLKGIKEKESKKSSNKVNSKENLCKSKRYVKNVNKESSSEAAETLANKKVCNVPIWKQYLNTSKSNQREKKCSNVDVYDIAQDEELMSSEVEVKNKKKRRVLKKNLNAFSTKNKTSKLVVNKLPKVNQATLIINNAEFATANKQLTHVEISGPSHFAHPLQDKNEQNPLPFPSNLDELGEIEHTILDQTLNCTNLSHLAEELEKSFLIVEKLIPAPKMTSTPDPLNSKCVAQPQNSNASKAASFSNITAINQQCLNATVETPTDSENLPRESDKDDGEITLFESPAKPEKKKLCSPKRTIQINLFGEVLKTPSSVNSSDDSALMPRKAYHTPDNFKTHLVRAKRAERQPKKKSKEEVFYEKMADHFDEILHTELFVE